MTTSLQSQAGENIIQTEVGLTHEAMKNVRRDMIPTRWAPGGCPRQSHQAGRPPSSSFVFADRTKPMSMTKDDVQRFQSDDLAINYLIKDLGRGEEHNIRGRTNKLPANLREMTQESKQKHRIDIPDLREATLRNQIAHSDKHKNSSFTSIIDPKSEFLKNKYHNLYNRTSTPLRAVMGLHKPYEKSSEEHLKEVDENLAKLQPTNQHDAEIGEIAGESATAKSIRERLGAYQNAKQQHKQRNTRPSSRSGTQAKIKHTKSQANRSSRQPSRLSRSAFKLSNQHTINESSALESEQVSKELTHDALAAHHAKHVSPWDTDQNQNAQQRPGSAISFRSSRSSMRHLENRVQEQEDEISALRAQLDQACLLMHRNEFKKPLT